MLFIYYLHLQEQSLKTMNLLGCKPKTHFHCGLASLEKRGWKFQTSKQICLLINFSHHLCLLIAEASGTSDLWDCFQCCLFRPAFSKQQSHAVNSDQISLSAQFIVVLSWSFMCNSPLKLGQALKKPTQKSPNPWMCFTFSLWGIQHICFVY